MAEAPKGEGVSRNDGLLQHDPDRSHFSVAGGKGGADTATG